jgi:mycoredoxin-dependent peroxiredoxin
VGISADLPERNLEWTKALNLPHRLLSDVSPKGRTSRLYGAWDGLWGLSKRVTFIIDRTGRVRYVEVGNPAIDANRALQALQRLAAKTR